MPRSVKIFITRILSSAAMIGLMPEPGQARNIDLDFYQLYPGMSAKDISAILGEPLPKRCRARGEELKFEGKAGAYTIRLDSRGHFFRMDWQQKRRETLMTEDTFRATAETHKCGDGKPFEIIKNIGTFISRPNTIPQVKTLDSLTAKFQGRDYVQLTLAPSPDGRNEYRLSCFRLEKDNTDRLEDFCKFGAMPCPSISYFRLSDGSRF